VILKQWRAADTSEETLLYTALEADNSSFGGGKLDVDLDPSDTHPGNDDTKNKDQLFATVESIVLTRE
jgi:hypothetical protein